MENINLLVWSMGIVAYLAALVLDKIGDSMRFSPKQVLYYLAGVVCGLMSGLLQAYSVWSYNGTEFAIAFVLSMVVTGFLTPLVAGAIVLVAKVSKRKKVLA